MNSYSIVVFEKRPRWEPELQRQFEGEPVHVRGSRSISDIASATAPETAGIAVLDFASAPADCLQFLESRIDQSSADRPVIVIGSRESLGMEWNIRDLGVLEFLTDESCGADLARLCRRHWKLANSSGMEI